MKYSKLYEQRQASAQKKIVRKIEIIEKLLALRDPDELTSKITSVLAHIRKSQSFLGVR